MLPVWTGLKFCHLLKGYPITAQSGILTIMKKMELEKIAGKEGNAG